MSWLQHHREGEQLASEAEVCWREGRQEAAQRLYLRAADAEERAIAALDRSKTRTLGISVVSAASLYYKACEYERAEEVAARWLPDQIPGFAKDQLRALLQSVWSELVRGEANARFAQGQVLISVRGGEVVQGGAPLDLITEKMKAVASIYYRTAEFLANVSHRTRGLPSRAIQESCRPWLFQAAAGSYQFAVAVQESRQGELFDNPIQPDKVADCFLSILRAGIDDPNGRLAEIVPDSDYRSTFLKLTRNLAPRGNACESIEIRSADEPKALMLDSEAREGLSKTIRNLKTDHVATDHPDTLRGTLRALHLDRDWIELMIQDDLVKVQGVGEQVDDVIGPMVNKHVVVHVVTRGGKAHFVDIEPDD